MEILLLGTGSADGWPNPFCRCASCRSAAAAGEVRAQTAAHGADIGADAVLYEAKSRGRNCVASETDQQSA